jgi:enoyl-CoA hydratase
VTSDHSEQQTVRYEVLEGGIARVTLARPECANAQNKRMTYELNSAFDQACRDDNVKVIVLAAEGHHFSAGHDLRESITDVWMDGEFEAVGTWASFRGPGMEGFTAMEHEVFLDMCWRWRNLPKPTIAQVQGKTIAGGLMLLWVCDMIIASDDAVFADPVVGFGINGVEYFAHPWELGPRKAKEMLFTGDFFSAADAKALGMVNDVVPRAELETFTLDLARRIAAKPSFALKLAKQSVNQALDAQGQWTALQAAFSIQELAHAHNKVRFGDFADPTGLGGDYRSVRPEEHAHRAHDHGNPADESSPGATRER